MSEQWDCCQLERVRERDVLRRSGSTYVGELQIAKLQAKVKELGKEL